MTARLVQGSLVIANYIKVTTDSETSIHRGKDHKQLFVTFSQEVHDKMPMLAMMLPSEDTMLLTARILWGSMMAQLGSLGTRMAWCHLRAWLKNKGDINIWSVSGANPSTGSEQTKVVVTTRAIGTPAVNCQVSSSVNSTIWRIFGYSEDLKHLVWCKMICSEANQFGRHYMWSWNRNVDTNNVFEKSI